MMTEAEYTQYTKDFNEACAGDGTAFGAFFDKYYEPNAVFEYIPNATKNSGKEVTVSFWKSVHDIMQEEIKPHSSLVISERKIAVEAPIDFLCKKDLEWVGEKHKAGSSFRLLMAAFYDLSDNGKMEYVRVYSIYHHDYQLK
jgi:hypothetical protein